MPMISGKLEVTYINTYNDIVNLLEGLVQYLQRQKFGRVE